MLLVGADRWSPKRSRDDYREEHKIVRDKTQAYSHCKHCGTQFVDSHGKPVVKQFAFCGEELSVQGKCKKDWIEACDLSVKAKKPTPSISQPLDEERLADTSRIHGPKVKKMPRKFASFCPNCVEVVVVNGRETRRTKGMYREIEHECGDVVREQ
jgi:hypothetical protein